MIELRVLSVRQPWATAIIELGKDIENRGRTNPYRGLLLIHASAGMTIDEYDEARGFIDRRVGLGLPSARSLERGGIIGAVEMVDCVKAYESPWWIGPVGFVLRNPLSLPFIPCPGTVAPLFWRPDPEVTDQAEKALRRARARP